MSLGLIRSHLEVRSSRWAHYVCVFLRNLFPLKYFCFYVFSGFINFWNQKVSFTKNIILVISIKKWVFKTSKIQVKDFWISESLDIDKRDLLWTLLKKSGTKVK